MTDILSQDEIDALLNQAAGTETKKTTEPMQANTGMFSEVQEVMFNGRKRKLKKYDFRRPDKFSKDQIRTLQMVHETFARLATTALSGQLRSNIGVHVASVDQMTYEEFTRSVVSPTTLGIINMDPLKGSAVIEIDPSITFTFIDRLFGGKGEPIATHRELTDIERSVIEGLIVRLLVALREAWSNVIDLRPRLGTIEVNPQFAGVVPPTTMTVLITFLTKIQDVEGMINFCIPYITIEPIITRLSAQFWYSAVSKGISMEDMNLIREQIVDIPLAVSAQLGETKLTINELTSLKEGDLIMLHRDIKAPVEIIVGNSSKFTAKIGIKNKRKAVQVLKVDSELNAKVLHDILMGEEK